jgi:hypothetical protein
MGPIQAYYHLPTALPLVLISLLIPPFPLQLSISLYFEEEELFPK